MNGAEWWLALDRVGFRAAWVLLSALWQSSILLAAAGLLAYALRRRRATVRHAILAAAILASPLIPVLGWAASRSGTPQAPIPVMPAYSAPVLPAEPAELAPFDVVSPPEPLAGELGVSEAAPVPEAQPVAPQPPEKPFSLLDYPWALALLAYAVGAVCFLSLVTIGKHRIGLWVRRGRVMTDTRVLGIFRAARERLGLDRDVIVMESRRILSPMTVGTLHPVILLPAGLARDSSDEDLLAIGLHELAHIRRHDSLLLTLLSVVRAMFFFHPLVWLACRQVSALAESACDDAVLSATGEPVSYAKMLARLAEQLPRRALATELAVGIVWSKGAFLRRVEAILSDRRNRIRRLSRVALLATVVASIISIGLALALPLGEKEEEQASQAATQEAGPSAKKVEARIGELIERLGSRRHADRGAAQAELVKIGPPAIAALQEAAVVKDPERAHRARQALKQIAERAVTGVARQFLAAMLDGDAEAMGKLMTDDSPYWLKGPVIQRALGLRHYGKRLERPFAPREILFKANLAAVRIEGPSAGAKYLALILRKAEGRWRVYQLNDSNPPSPLTGWLDQTAKHTAFKEYATVRGGLLKGESREAVARRFRSIAERYPDLKGAETTRQLAALLERMAEEDRAFREPKDPAKLSEKERIRYLVYKLRDVAETGAFVPGKCRVLSHPRTYNSPAVALRQMGKAAVPALIDLMTDDRPTRSNDLLSNGGHILRYCDVALQILEAIAAKRFNDRTMRGAHLANADGPTRRQIIERVKAWWAANKDKTEVQWLRAALVRTGKGDLMWYSYQRRDRLVELEGMKAVEFLREGSDHQPRSANVLRSIWRIDGPAGRRYVRSRLGSKDSFVRAAAYEVLIEAGEPGALDAAVKELHASMGERRLRRPLLMALAGSGRDKAVLTAVRLLEHEDPAIALDGIFALTKVRRPSPKLLQQIVPHAAAALEREDIKSNVKHWIGKWLAPHAKPPIRWPIWGGLAEMDEALRQVRAWLKARPGPTPASSTQPAAKSGKAVEGLQVSIRVKGKVFDADKPIGVHWSIRNVGQTDKAIYWHDLHYSPVFFDITTKDRRTYPNRADTRRLFVADTRRLFVARIPSPPVRLVLRPGETKEARFDLRRFLGTLTGELHVVGVYAPKASQTTPKQYLEAGKFQDAAMDRIASAPIRLTVHRDHASGRLKLDEDIPAPAEVWHEPMPPGRSEPFRVVAAEALRFENRRGLLVATLKLGYSSWPKDAYLSRLELRDKDGNILATDEASFESSGLIETRPLWDKEKLQFDLGRLGGLTGAKWFRLTLNRVSSAGASTQPETKQGALRSLDLSGTWAGERDAIKATIEFYGNDGAATWCIEVPRTTIVSDLILVDDQEAGTVALRLDYTTTANGRLERGSAVIGRLERNASSELALNILPAAAQLESEYPPASRIVLQRVAPANWRSPAAQTTRPATPPGGKSQTDAKEAPTPPATQPGRKADGPESKMPTGQAEDQEARPTIFSAFHRRGPFFNLDSLSVKATHVALVTENPDIDGHLKVLESWKGDLGAGESISVPELKCFANADLRRVISYGADGRVVSGARMIVFLVKSLTLPEQSAGDNRGTRWLPAGGFGYTRIFAGNWKGRDNTQHMAISIAWVEREQVYAVNGGGFGVHVGIRQLRNETVEKARARVRFLAGKSEGLAKAGATADPSHRAQALLPFLSESDHRRREHAFMTLADCGEPALRHLRGILADDDLADQHYLAVKALVKAGGNEVEEELTGVLREELEFWRTVPGVNATEWNNLPAGLRSRCFKLEQILQGLTWLKGAKAQDLVRDIVALERIGQRVLYQCERYFNAIEAKDLVPPATQPAVSDKTLSTEEMVKLIDEAQKRNRSLIPVSGEGLMTMTDKRTVAGQKAMVARCGNDGLNGRVVRGIGTPTPSDPNSVDVYQRFFYDEGWQVVETL